VKRVALLLYVVSCAVVIAPPAWAAEPPRASDLEAELVCPICGTTLDQSDSPVAVRMKAFIRARIAAGDSAGQIKAKLVDQFGPRVIASPPGGGFGLLAWLLPIAVAAIAAVAIALLVRSWSRRRAPPPDDDRPLDASLERRVDEELARFEG
jgi:cytochrome c-type biogenesis protein CcmH